MRGNAATTQRSDRTPIHIIGGGDAGIGVALSHLAAGYPVEIYDAMDALRMGTSRGWIRLHEGGEYPSDLATAMDLLHAAVVMSKLMPGVIYNPVQGVEYLISAAAQKEGIRTVEKQREVMDALALEYARLCNEDPSCIELLGKPEQFREYADAEALQETEEGRLVGGAGTNERGINPIIMAKVLLDKLRAYEKSGRLVVHTGHRLETIKRNAPGQFTTSFMCNGELVTKELQGRVINCAGISALDVAAQVEGAPALRRAGIAAVDLHYRGMGVANTSKVPAGGFFGTRAIFPMGAVHFAAREGDTTCGMFAPVTSTVSLCWGPSEQVSYWPVARDGTATVVSLSPENPKVPESFWSTMADGFPRDKIARMQRLEERLHATYPLTDDVQVVDFIPAPLVVVRMADKQHSNDPYAHLAERTRKGPMIVGQPDFETHFLEKGTHFAIDGLESLQMTLRYDVARGTITPVAAQEIFARMYDGELDQPLLPTRVNRAAWFTVDEKAEVELASRTRAYQMELVALAVERFGAEIGPLLVEAEEARKRPRSGDLTASAPGSGWGARVAAETHAVGTAPRTSWFPRRASMVGMDRVVSECAAPGTRTPQLQRRAMSEVGFSKQSDSKQHILEEGPWAAFLEAKRAALSRLDPTQLRRHAGKGIC